MRVQRIYVDTSVSGGCHDPEFSLWSNGLMQDFRDGTYRPVISEVVATAIEGAPTIVQDIYAQLLALNAEIVEVTGEALTLADAYQRRGVLPARSSADALHIALATMTGVDVLVRWMTPPLTMTTISMIDECNVRGHGLFASARNCQ